jgi:hypothetical protein
MAVPASATKDNDQCGKVGPFSTLSKAAQRRYHQYSWTPVRLYWRPDFGYETWR